MVSRQPQSVERERSQSNDDYHGTFIVGRPDLTPPPQTPTLQIAANAANVSLAMTMLIACVSGLWFFATQSATNLATADRVARNEASFSARLDGLERKNDQRTETINAIELRVSEIKGKLDWMISNLPPARR